MSKRALIARELDQMPEPDLVAGIPRFAQRGAHRHGYVELGGGILAFQGLARARGGCGLGQFVRGDVVVINFPFSALSQTKRRPALIIATLKGNDVMLPDHLPDEGR